MSFKGFMKQALAPYGSDNVSPFEGFAVFIGAFMVAWLGVLYIAMAGTKVSFLGYLALYFASFITAKVVENRYRRFKRAEKKSEKRE